jgi:hypothetical protein
MRQIMTTSKPLFIVTNDGDIAPLRKTYKDWQAYGRNVRLGQHGLYCPYDDNIKFSFEQTRAIRPWSDRKHSVKPIDYDSLPAITDYITLSLLFAKRGVIFDPVTPDTNDIRVFKAWANIGRYPIKGRKGLRVKRMTQSVSVSGGLIETWQVVTIWHRSETLPRDAYIKRYGQTAFDKVS